MAKELKEFFKEIESSPNAFLLFRLYYNPGCILGNEQKDISNEEYFNMPIYYYLLLNSNLARFLEIALKYEEFSSKLNIQMYKMLNASMRDSIVFIRNWYSGYNWFEEEINSKFHRSVEYSNEQLYNYNEVIAMNVVNLINSKIEILQRKEINQISKEFLLNRILQDDYDGSPTEIYLATHLTKPVCYDNNNQTEEVNAEILDFLICENRFLDVLELLLESKKLKGIPLDNVIDILDVSIRIKKYIFPNSKKLRARLGDTLVNEFDLKKAEKLLSDLVLYKLKREKKSNDSNIFTFKKAK